MYRRVDLSSRQSWAISTRLRVKWIATLLGCFAAVGLSGQAVQAQDLTKYAASPISVFASSSTAGSDGEDGIPATSASFGTLTLATDASGNVYFADGGSRVRMIYVAGPVPPLLQFALTFNGTLAGQYPTTAALGDVYTIANVVSAACSGDACGDGGQAAGAAFGTPFGLAFDSDGNLYISDIGTSSVRKVSVTDGTISTVAGDPLHSATGFNGDNIPANGAFLTSPAFIALDGAKNLFIADLGNNLIRRVDASSQTISTVAGDNTQPGTYCSDNVCGEGGPATAALLGAANGVAVNAAGDIFIAETNTNVVRRVDHSTGNINTYAGQLGVPCADSSCGGEGVAATSATLNYPFSVHLDASGAVIITDQVDNAVRGVLADGTIRTLAGTLNQAGGLGPLTGPASGAMFNFPEDATTDAAGNLFVADFNNNLLWKVNAPVNLLPQTITFNQIPNATYGNPSFDLTRYASSDSGLGLTFTCAGPVTCTGTDGATLTITGAGTVTVTANQAGNTMYAPATPKVSTFQVAKAVLTVKADNLSFAFKSMAQLPTLTYTLAGFVNGDSQSAVTGTPVLTTTALPTSPVGQYPITVTTGTLAAANYSFTPQNGVLTITGGVAQTITFAKLPNVTYGVATFNLTATATSGGPVSFTVVGPAELLGTALTVTGAGTVTVTANQPGDESYAPAPAVTQSFQVAPGVLTITAQPVTRGYNSANPAFTYAASGFVSADTAAVLSGAPAYATTATAASTPGTYPLTITQGTLFATNYTFTFVNSTVTVTKAAQTITFPAIPSATFGITVVLNATSSSGLPVTYTVSGPAIITDGNAVQGTAPGTATVTASQAGGDLYEAAPPATQPFVVAKSTVQLNATNFTIPFGAPIPTLTYEIQGGFVLPTSQYSGQPDIETAAMAGSPPGQYPIVLSQGTLVSSFYDFRLVNGTLTILPPSSFILTASPPAITIPVGQARQTTILLTPVNNFIGTVTLGCSGLPAGVTCTASPNTLTTVLGSAGNAVQPVSATLTISAGAPIATAQNHSATDLNRTFIAGWFWIPSLLLGGLLTWQRKRLLLGRSAWRLMLVACLLAGASSLIACGTSSGGSNSVQPGTTMIQVTGAGTSTSGDTSASLSLSVTIQ